jgi:isoleucyl-tRNA synthetase
MSGDKLAAYETFFTVLGGVAKLAAPFVPFLSEAIFLNLRGDKDNGNEPSSVHLAPFPEVDPSRIDERLEEDMAGVLKAVTLGRAVRNKAGIKVRTPLSKMLLCGGSAGWLESEELRGLVLDELNVKGIEQVESTDQYISTSVKPDYSLLGKRFGKSMKAAATALEGLGDDSIGELVGKGEVDVKIEKRMEKISLDEVKVVRETSEGFEAEVDGDLTVILDTKLTDELRREGMARDLVNRIQNFRKESGFEVSDRIELSWTAPEEAALVIGEYRDHICSETLVEKIHEGEKDWENTTSFELDGLEISLWVKLA